MRKVPYEYITVVGLATTVDSKTERKKINRNTLTKLNAIRQ